MMKSLVFVLFIFTGCVSYTSILDESATDHIKRGSKLMVYHSSLERSALYDKIYTALLTNGFRIDNNSEERGFIQTQQKNIGQGTLSRINIFVEAIKDSSQATFRTEYKPDAEMESFASSLAGTRLETDFEPAAWGIGGRSELAYAYTLKFIYSLSPEANESTVIHVP